ncbi:MAG: hypothetical protein Q7S00_02715 [bacterium]|nr:hypothetical protein [bacterium]
MIKRMVALLMVFIFSSSCAAMFHGTKETIHVRSERPNTIFFAGEQEIGRGSSAVVTIRKKKLSKTILRAEKKGCLSKTTPIETSFDGISLLGLLIDLGLISILVVDLGATGAVHEADQTDYILTPQCS